MLHGEVLYRQVYLYLTPLTVYLFAGWLKVLGTSILAGHIALWVVRSLGVAVWFLVARELLSLRVALLATLAYLFWYVPEPTNFSYHWTANLMEMLGLWALLRWQRAPTPARMVGTGLACALAGWTLQTFGAVLVGTSVLVAVGRGEMRQLGWLALGLALGVLPGVAGLAAGGDLDQFLQDTLGSNLYRTSLEKVPLPVAFSLLLGLLRGPWWQVCQGLTLLGALAVGLLGPLPWLRENRALLTVYLANLLTLLACSYKLMPSQLLLHAHLLLMLSAWVLARIPRRATLLAMVPFLALGWYHWSSARAPRFPVYFPRGEAGAGSAEEAQALQALVRFLEKRTVGRAGAFFTPYEPSLYFLMDLRNPTRYDQLRALQYSPAQMREALGDLAGVRVFRFPAYDDRSFLSANWPSADLNAYERQTQDFYQALQATHKFEDFGAVQGFFPR